MMVKKSFRRESPKLENRFESRFVFDDKEPGALLAVLIFNDSHSTHLTNFRTGKQWVVVQLAVTDTAKLNLIPRVDFARGVPDPKNLEFLIWVEKRRMWTNFLYVFICFLMNINNFLVKHLEAGRICANKYITKLADCQTGMRGAFDNNKPTVIEALRRAKYKFPGRQKIIVSKKWGFTKLSREEYMEKRQNGLLQPDGAYVKYLSHHGPLSKTSCPNRSYFLTNINKN
ncbi:unnamed protein product [Rhizophagus irregularis]|nr:unnamed protein product [Rhizophagus irregularis]